MVKIGQQEILDYFKNNKTKKMTASELRNIFNCSNGTITRALKCLRETRFIGYEYSLDSHCYQYFHKK